MLTSLKVENYKSLNNTEIHFSDFTVLAGNNCTGKSTVLQAIDFLVNSCHSDFLTILERRGLTVSDILSKLPFSKGCRITFRSEWNLQTSNGQCSIVWDMEIDCNAKDNSMRLFSEKIIDALSNRALLTYEHRKGDKWLIIQETDGKLREYPSITLTSSALKVFVDLEGKDIAKRIPELVALKKFLSSSYAYDLLSPSEMRQSSRGIVTNIGNSGKDLPAFMKGMNEERKASFNHKLHDLVGDFIETIGTRTEGRPGWTRMEAQERFLDQKVIISSKNMSDGMLRLLAFLAITETDSSNCLILLDEIENGINVSYSEKLIKILKQSCLSNKQQMIVTTHSTLFLDYVSPEDIVFLKRNSKTGKTEAIGMLDISGIRKRLEYLYPGEVILNMTNEERASLILADNEAEDGTNS